MAINGLAADSRRLESGKPDASATADLLSVLRTGTPDDAAKCVTDRLCRHIAPVAV
ncbi:MAG: hypothetical protein U0996_17695 [Planctomycetaceae bacterium]